MKTHPHPHVIQTRRQTFSIPSLVAVVAAILSFLVSAGWGMLLAMVAIVAGVIGCVMAMSARTRGGIVSMASIVAGGLGIVAAILRLLF